MVISLNLSPIRLPLFINSDKKNNQYKIGGYLFAEMMDIVTHYFNHIFLFSCRKSHDSGRNGVLGTKVDS